MIPPAASSTTGIAAHPPSAHPRPAPPSRFGNGFLAAAASLWLAGLGHWLARDRRRAVGWFLGYVAVAVLALLAISVPQFVPALIVVVPLGVAVVLACSGDAFRVARRPDVVPRLSNAVLRVLAGIGFIAAAAGVPAGLPLGLLARAQFAETFEFPSTSMAPTLIEGDRFVVHKRSRAYQRWDVVAFRYPENPELMWAMRIAGLPGERVEIVDGIITIDGRPVMLPSGLGPKVNDVRSVSMINGSDEKPLVLAHDEYFVLGDDTARSNDSRFWRDAPPGHQPGAVPADLIVGRATWTYWPPSRWRNLEPQR